MQEIFVITTSDANFGHPDMWQEPLSLSHNVWL